MLFFFEPLSLLASLPLDGEGWGEGLLLFYAGKDIGFLYANHGVFS